MLVSWFLTGSAVLWRDGLEDDVEEGRKRRKERSEQQS